MNDKVTQILLDRLISTAEESGKLPWESPWHNFNAFNWYTLNEYRGINRWLVPQGEYLTAKQINTYNKQTGKNYKFKKGIKWLPVLFVRNVEKVISKNEVPEPVLDAYNSLKAKGKIGTGITFLCYEGYYAYIFEAPSKFIRVRKVRVFHQVADRQFFVDENGECLPSKISTGEVELTKSHPADLFNNYIHRERIKLISKVANEAYYAPLSDAINLPPLEYFKSEDNFYATAFHEAGHSTGACNRLNRIGVAEASRKKKVQYSKEEVIAELCASLLCAESGIMAYEPQDCKLFDNHASYLQGYLNFLKTTKDDIVYMCSDAEKAFQFILSATDNETEEGVDC